MASPFDLLTVAETILVASSRVLPVLIEGFGIASIYDTIVALNPVVTAAWITVLLSGLQVLLFIITGSVAWNDRLWSIIPLIYACLYGLHPVISLDRRTGGSFDTRLSLMCGLIFFWGIRLTFNAARRGFYRPGFVDYRYDWFHTNIVKNKFLFGLIYSSCCSTFTLLSALITSPLYFAWVRRGLEPKLGILDAVATVGMIGGIFMEAVADDQQYEFQRGKAAWRHRCDQKKDEVAERNKAIPKDFEEGFLQSGLFRWSRHPNFFAEMLLWWCFYVFSVAGSGRWLNWTIIGPISYVCIFQITTSLTEHISSQKYPGYKLYQKRVSRLVPLPTSLVSPPTEKPEPKEKTS